ncbi:unnamed protein product [Caenorhabditis brenneri]
MSDRTDDKRTRGLRSHPWAPKASPEPSHLPAILEARRSDVLAPDEQTEGNEPRIQQKQKVKMNQVKPIDVNHHTDNQPAIPRRVRNIPPAQPQTDDQFDFTAMEVQEDHGNLGIIVQSTTITSEFSVALDCCYCFVACIFLWKMFPPMIQHLECLILGGHLRFLMIIGQILRHRYFSNQPNRKKIRSSWKHNTILLAVRVFTIIADLYNIWTIIQSLTANIVVQIVSFTWNILHLCGLIMQQSFINEKLNDERTFRRGSSTTQTASV